MGGWQSSTKKIQSAKPDWAIGYASFALTSMFSPNTIFSSHGSDPIQDLEYAAKFGLPNLDQPIGQTIIAEAKSYACMQGDLNAFDNPLVWKSLSNAVGTEARVALQMYSSRFNIGDVIKSNNPNITEEELKHATRASVGTLLERPLDEEGKQLKRVLIEAHLRRGFEDIHQQEYFPYALEAAQKLHDYTSGRM